jgi:hypothetical protein
MELSERLVELRSKHAHTGDLEQAKLLQHDIHNVERALAVEAELRMTPDAAGASKRMHLAAAAQRPVETDAEFRARAERELARVKQV